MGKKKSSKTKVVEKFKDPKGDTGKYIQKLTMYCHAVGIEIVYVDTDDKDNEYLSDGKKRKVTLHPGKNKWTVLACFLHELGHGWDEVVNPKKFWSEYLVVTGSSKTERRVERKLWVIEAEIRAWDYGLLIAKNCQIPVGKWYQHRREKFLATYKEASIKAYTKKEV